MKREERKHPGRPPLFGERMESYPIHLPKWMIKACKKLGNGNLGQGVRAAIEGYFKVVEIKTK